VMLQAKVKLTATSDTPGFNVIPWRTAASGDKVEALSCAQLKATGRCCGVTGATMLAVTGACPVSCPLSFASQTSGCTKTDKWNGAELIQDVVRDLRKKIQAGRFQNSKNCKKRAKEFFTDDVHIDNRGPQKDPDYFGEFDNIAGLCDMLTQEYGFDMDSKMKQEYFFYTRGDNNQPDSVVEFIRSFPMYGKQAATNKKGRKKKSRHYNVYTFEKIGSKMKVKTLTSYYDKPTAWDALCKVKGNKCKGSKDAKYSEQDTTRTQTLMNTLGAFAQLKFLNKKTTSQDCQAAVPNFFTDTAVIDYRRAGTKRLEPFQKYPAGKDGVCQWYQEAYSHAFDTDFKTLTYPRGVDDGVVMKIRCRPGIVCGPPPYVGCPWTAQYNLQLMHVTFNADGTKIQKIENLFANPAVWDEFADLLMQEHGDHVTPKGCVTFMMEDKMYSPNMAGGEPQVMPNVKACQQRCKTVTNCMHLTWEEDAKECTLQDAGAKVEFAEGKEAGYPPCGARGDWEKLDPVAETSALSGED